MKMNRREFLGTVKGSAGLLAVGGGFLNLGCRGEKDLLGPGETERPPEEMTLPGRIRLPIPDTIHPEGLALGAQPGSVSSANGGPFPAWMYRESLPGPTLRVRSGDTVRLDLQNGLPEETIVHWHGLDVPEHADGHPRFAVSPGQSFAYDFSVRNRAGTYWYHPHTHRRTGAQTYRGLAGFLIVDDAEDEGLGLPSGDREIPLVIQDKRLDGSGTPVYEPFGPDLMLGYLKMLRQADYPHGFVLTEGPEHPDVPLQQLELVVDAAHHGDLGHNTHLPG